MFPTEGMSLQTHPREEVEVFEEMNAGATGPQKNEKMRHEDMWMVRVHQEVLGGFQ